VIPRRTEIAQAFAKERGGDPERFRRYLTQRVRYGLGPHELTGLETFLARAAARGFLPPTQLRFADDRIRSRRVRRQVSLDGADAVDEVRIKLGGGKPYREWEALSYPVRLTGTGMPVAQRAQPAWLEEMLSEEKERYRQNYEQRMSEPVSTGGMLFMMFFMLAVLALLVVGAGAPLWGVWKWRGGWRIGAAVPALVMAFVIGRIVVDTARDPTSHNLWPFEILMWGGASAVVMGVLALIRRLAR